jgi:hypothetical protein
MAARNDGDARLERQFVPFADGQVERPRGARGERDGDDLPALTQHGQGAVAPFESEFVGVGAERLGDPQSVDRQQ